MFIPRTDLAIEAHEIASNHKSHIVDGVLFDENDVDGYRLTRIEILSPDGKAATGKPVGKYLTLDVGRIWEREDETQRASLVLADLLSETAGECDSVFIAGLGNTAITADALGPFAIEHIIVTRHLRNEASDIFDKMGFADVSALAPGVLSQTGVESTEIIKSMAELISPSAVVVIDALASKELSRLGTVIQISNTGISPGSGVGNSRPALNQESIGVPVISIGVPTVVDALTVASSIIERCDGNFGNIEASSEFKNMFVTPKECDKIISFLSKVIGYAINVAFHKDLSFEDMKSVLS